LATAHASRERRLVAMEVEGGVVLDVSRERVRAPSPHRILLQRGIETGRLVLGCRLPTGSRWV